ncbi:recombinase family protein [Aeromicrobium sp. Leaf291]|uniref:recombinase family protein n=1 Tax=Aeromicrobium sp. Leaf291 TaxID=1736325 RepID=UPI0006F852E0|nr:recombinase family protein [Aeromicrobium sp. Leaf291]KQP81637.1 hypothetical protein ASF35_16540 [Aeromicrobium sp. Leaf291]
MNTQSRRAAVYVRISKDRSAEGLGVARQEAECRELATRLGLEVGPVYVDNDLSASTGKPRPSYRAMLEAMSAGQLDAVLAWHPDRLYRRPDDLEELIGVADGAGVTFATVKAGELDLATASGRMVARFLGAAARYETERQAERQSSKARELAQAGRNSGGGYRPFGWADDRLALDPVEADALRHLIDMALAGQAVNAMCSWLTASGIKTTAGGTRWSSVAVKRMLTSPRLAGLSVYKGEVVGRGEWEPLIDETTHRRVVEALTYRGPARANRARVALLSSAMLRCGICGYGLLTFRRNESRDKQRAYGCREATIAGRPGYGLACGRVSIRAEALEEDIANRVLARILRNRRAIATSAEGVRRPDSAAGELGELEARLRDLGVDYADGLLGRVEFRAARDRLTELIEAARSRLEAAEAQDGLPVGSAEEVAAWWDAASLSQRQVIVRGQILRILIGAHSGGRAHYDAGRVTIEWR